MGELSDEGGMGQPDCDRSHVLSMFYLPGITTEKGKNYFINT
jgi:hypothetical protein